MNLARPLVLVAIVAALLAAAWVPPAFAAPGDVRVQAEFDYREGPYGEKKGVRLKIWRDGEKVLDRRTGVDCGGGRCETQPPYGRRFIPELRRFLRRLGYAGGGPSGAG